VVIESNAFVVPEVCILWIDRDTFVKSLNCIIVFAQFTESYAFVDPG
jgi:hypothetical protein